MPLLCFNQFKSPNRLHIISLDNYFFVTCKDMKKKYVTWHGTKCQFNLMWNFGVQLKILLYHE